MSEIDNALKKELDRLLGLTPVQEPRTPEDSICSLSIEIDKRRIFQPLSTEEELALALKKGHAAKAEKAKYSEDLYKASRVLERQFRIPEAEKALEKLVIFDENADCFDGVAAEHLFQLGILEERQGKFDEAESHFKQGVAETKQERKERLEDDFEYQFQLKKRTKGIQPETDDQLFVDVPRNLRKAETYAALARLANRKGNDQEARELLIRAYNRVDGPDGEFLKKAADPKNFYQLYYEF